MKLGEDLPLSRCCRPASLLLVHDKIDERIFLTQLQRFYTGKTKGFRPKHSMSHHILWVIEYIHDAFDNFEHIGPLYLDVTKAFDRVWHCGLTYKMIKLKLIYVQFILSHLHNRIFSFILPISSPIADKSILVYHRVKDGILAKQNLYS